MSEEAKDFIKYVAEVIVILTIFLVIFSPEGIGSNLFNYLKYVEPILLQDWLSTSINVGSRSPGNFTTTTRLSGQPHTILIYTEDSKIYVNVEPPEETYLKTKFAIIEPTKIITNCEVIDQKIKLKENVVQTITVRKIIEEEACKIYISTSGKEEIKSGLNLQQKSSTQVSLPEEPATPSIDCNSQCRSQGFTSGECKDNCKLGETPLYKTDGDGFYIKAADAHITAFLPYSKNYQPNAWGFVEDLGINALRLFTGGEGDIAHLNMKRYPNEWAENLNNFLSEADAHGVKVYFYELGTEWNTLLGIRPEDTTIEEAKSMIDKLTGDNNLGHDFINDDRILVWSVDNEPSISENPSREEDYKRLEWILEISDYIRSKGGKTVVASPRLDDNWGRGQDFHVTEPIFRGHVDYLERHSYKSVEFYQTCVDTGNSFSFEDCYNKIYASYKKLLQEEMIDDRGSFSIDQLIFGEFGVWIGESGTKANQGCINCFFEDEHRRAYYKAVLDAARDVGIKNICFHNLFSRTEGPTWTKNLIPDYGVVDVDGTYHDEELAIIIRDVYKSEESYCDSGFVCCCSGELPAESDCELECERLDFASGVCRKTTHALITKGANIPANQLVSVSSTYPKQYWAFPEQDYAWKTLQDLGVNAIQVWGGIEGNVLHIQANENHPWGKNYDSNWAENLESFLAKADSYGMKVVFHEMGNQYGTGLGIVPPMHNYRSVSPYSSLDNAIAVIDKIGGNNNLDKNFFEDDRVLWWTPINEARLDVDEVRNWLIPVLQRIKYYGGKTSVCVNDKKGRSYAEAFPYITPLIGDYIDYLQAHRYQEPVIRSITNQGPQADMYQPAYEAFSADFQSMIEGRGKFGIDKLALTEFGTGFDEWEYHYGTDITTIEQQADYIRAAFDAAQDKGITKLFWFNPIQIHSDYNSFGFIEYDGTIIDETYNAFKTTQLSTKIAETTCESRETLIEVGCNPGYVCCCSGESYDINVKKYVAYNWKLFWHGDEYRDYSGCWDMMQMHYEPAVSDNIPKRIKQVDSNIEILLYRNTRAVYSRETQELQLFRQNNWILKTNNGEEIVSKDYPSNFMVDKGNPDYQEWFSNWMKDYAETYGYDGAFLDNSLFGSSENMWNTMGVNSHCNAQTECLPINPRTGSYWTNDDWIEADAGLINKVKEKFGDKVVVLNGPNNGRKFFETSRHDNYEAVMQRSNMDGFIIELWMNDGSGNFYTEDNWKKSVDMICWIEKNLPKADIVIPVGTGWRDLPESVSNDDFAIYSFASLLLGASSNRYYMLQTPGEGNLGDYCRPAVQALYDVDLGVPLGDYRIIEGTRVYERDFSKVKVLVNPSTGVPTINLDQNYKTLDGKTVSKVTLGGHSGIVLLKIPSSPMKAIQWFRTSPFTSTSGFQSIEELREAIPSCNYIYMDVFIDSIDEVATPRTTYENELDPAVQKAKQEGFKVVWRVQPKVGVKLGNRLNFDTPYPDSFFSNYADAVVYWARKAEEYGVDDFVIGTELSKLEKYNDHWRSLIQNVKDVFTGKISYNTNFWYEDTDFDAKKSAVWMQDLDYIGVSAYWRMCSDEEAQRGVTVEELVNNWHSYVGWTLRGEDIVKDHLEVFSETHGKPIVIVTGLQSAEDACLTPWAWDRTTVDLNEQNNWYEAVFRVFSDEDWIYGFMFDGAWQTYANKRQNPDNAEFTVQGKLAEETVAKWFE